MKSARILHKCCTYVVWLFAGRLHEHRLVNISQVRFQATFQQISTLAWFYKFWTSQRLLQMNCPFRALGFDHQSSPSNTWTWKLKFVWLSYLRIFVVTIFSTVIDLSVITSRTKWYLTSLCLAFHETFNFWTNV